MQSSSTSGSKPSSKSKRLSGRLRIKSKIMTTPGVLLNYLFQNQIDLSFLEDEFSLSEDTSIPQSDAQTKALRKRGIAIVLENLNIDGIENISTNPIKVTPKNQIGSINISNIGHDKTLYFRNYAPHSDNLFYNILATMNPELLSQSKFCRD